MEGNCSDPKYFKHRMAKKIVFGAPLLLNAFVWPQWLGIDGLICFVAVLMIIFGLVHLVLSCCCFKKPAKRKR